MRSAEAAVILRPAFMLTRPQVSERRLRHAILPELATPLQAPLTCLPSCPSACSRAWRALRSARRPSCCSALPRPPQRQQQACTWTPRLNSSTTSPPTSRRARTPSPSRPSWPSRARHAVLVLKQWNGATGGTCRGGAAPSVGGGHTQPFPPLAARPPCARQCNRSTSCRLANVHARLLGRPRLPAGCAAWTLGCRAARATLATWPPPRPASPLHLHTLASATATTVRQRAGSGSLH